MTAGGALRVSLPLVTALLLLATLGGASAHAPRPAATQVLAIYQSADVTEQGNFTVSLQVSDTSNISFVYFTFCQLTSSLCYLPVSMFPHASGWYVGTTQPMTKYNGMKAGVEAGYNVTIVYTDNSTSTEPTIPNPFSNLTVAQSVTGAHYFAMTVRNQVYGLDGVVTDQATGAPLSGAKVTLTPGGNSTTTGSSGAYAFSGLENGTYSLAITKAGYLPSNVSVAIAGQAVVRNVGLSNASTPGGSGGPGPSGSGGGFFTTPLGMGLAVLLVAVIVASAGFAMYRLRRRSAPATPPASGDSEDSGTAPPSPPT